MHITQKLASINNYLKIQIFHLIATNTNAKLFNAGQDEYFENQGCSITLIAQESYR